MPHKRCEHISGGNIRFAGFGLRRDVNAVLARRELLCEMVHMQQLEIRSGKRLHYTARDILPVDVHADDKLIRRAVLNGEIHVELRKHVLLGFKLKIRDYLRQRLDVYLPGILALVVYRVFLVQQFFQELLKVAAFLLVDLVLRIKHRRQPAFVGVFYLAYHDTVQQASVEEVQRIAGLQKRHSLHVKFRAVERKRLVHNVHILGKLLSHERVIDLYRGDIRPAARSEILVPGVRLHAGNHRASHVSLDLPAVLVLEFKIYRGMVFQREPAGAVNFGAGAVYSGDVADEVLRSAVLR